MIVFLVVLVFLLVDEVRTKARIRDIQRRPRPSWLP